MKKAKIEDGFVVNIIEVDKNNIPDWCKDWPTATALTEIGGTYVDKTFVRPKVNPALVREDRNKRLAECDWTQLPDASVDQVAWAIYRQALRDVTQQEGFPSDVVWPEKP